jgi:putative ABC transport system permease protein
MAEHADLWVPLSPKPRDWLQRGADVVMIGRLAPDATRLEAQAELATLWRRVQETDPTVSQTIKVTLVPYSATAGGNSIVSTRGYQMLAIFSLVTLLTLTIVCANVANLLIARAATRERETALRRSLGASRVRIVRSLLAEGFVLALAAWISACVFAWWVSKVIVRFLVPADVPVVPPDLTPDWTVIGYALGLALLCTMAVTVGPALRAWRQPLLPFLKVGEAGSVQGRSRLSRTLVVIQLAFSILLLTTAGLAYRSLSLADSLDVGFDTRNILLVTVSTTGITEAPAGPARLDPLQRAIGNLPDVERVSYVAGLRLRRSLDFPLRREASADPVMAASSRVAPGYFATLGVPITGGRDFTPHDRQGRPAVILTRNLADSLFPGKSAVGQSLLAGRGDEAVQAEVIGVVRDAFFTGRGSETRPRHVFFADTGQLPPTGQTTFYVRHRGELARLGPAIMRALRDVDPRVPVASLRSLEAEVAADAAPVWMLTMLLTLFAVSSLLIAAIGHYAVVAFDARRRMREFGLRIALGASAQQLLTSVIRDSLWLTAQGLLVGFALSAAAGTVLARVLFGITPTDPPTYLSVFALLTVASLLASYLPARRAARTDLLQALRTE